MAAAEAATAEDAEEDMPEAETEEERALARIRRRKEKMKELEANRRRAFEERRRLQDVVAKAALEV